jgi:hypothetical protein
VRREVHTKSPASSANLERLKQTVNLHCPVLDDLLSPVAICLERESS